MPHDQNFSEWYQAHCDRMYWVEGRCCAGCDHWRSDAGNIGECTAGPILSGDDVMRSHGISSSSYRFAPGYPVTRANHHCGLFADGFDWSTLNEFYLHRIGAMVGNKLQPKPTLINQRTH